MVELETDVDSGEGDIEKEAKYLERVDPHVLVSKIGWIPMYR